MRTFITIAVFWILCPFAFANQSLHNITESCINDGSIGSAEFGKIVPNSDQQAGQSKYLIEGNYEDGVFNLSQYRDSGSDYSTIWFYSTIKNSQLLQGTNLFWHLMITPSEIQRKHNVRGYMKDVYMQMSLKNELITRRDFNYLIDRATKQNHFFLNNPCTDPVVEKEINNVWRKLINNRNMKAIYEEINRKEPPYMDFSLVLHRVSVDPQSINLERGGYLLPSSKKINRKGLAHGLVFDSKGNCLAHRTITIK